jgi:hypothetical protein
MRHAFKKHAFEKKWQKKEPEMQIFRTKRKILSKKTLKKLFFC